MRSGRAVALWALAVGYMAGIFVLSSLPVPTPAEEALARVGDKALHVLEYMVLALLLAFAIGSGPPPRLRRWAPLIALAVAVVYAATDEFHQSFVPGRDADVLDYVADLAGATLGAAVQAAWSWRAARRGPVSATSPR